MSLRLQLSFRAISASADLQCNHRRESTLPQHASMKQQVAKTTLKDGGNALQRRHSILRHNPKNPGLNITSTKRLHLNIPDEPQKRKLCISASRCLMTIRRCWTLNPGHHLAPLDLYSRAQL